MTEEIWKDIPNHKHHEISNLGRVRNKRNKLILKGKTGNDYTKVFLKNNDDVVHSLAIHRLVAKSFIENPNDYDVVNHIDNNRHNNVASNLEWVTKQQNNLHAVQFREKQIGQAIWLLDANRNKVQKFNTLMDAAKFIGIKSKMGIRTSLKNNSKIVNGRSWAYDDAIMECEKYDVHDDRPNEEWKKILEYDHYYISNYGRVKSSGRLTKNNAEEWNILKPQTNLTGYLSYFLCKSSETKSYFGHRLVATYFIPNIDKKEEVNHINGDTKNNHVSNLEWVTHKENMKHARSLKHNYNHKQHGIPVCKISLSGETIKQYDTILEASKDNNMSDKHIASVCKRKRRQAGGYIWRYIHDKEENVTLATINPKKVRIKRPPKKVIQYDLLGNKLREFESTQKAAECYGICRQTMGEKMRNNTTFHNSKFKYA